MTSTQELIVMAKKRAAEDTEHEYTHVPDFQPHTWVWLSMRDAYKAGVADAALSQPQPVALGLGVDVPMPPRDRVEFALRDAGFDLDECARIADLAHPGPTGGRNPCPGCNGSKGGLGPNMGYVPCRDCDGEGFIYSDDDISPTIPAGHRLVPYEWKKIGFIELSALARLMQGSKKAETLFVVGGGCQPQDVFVKFAASPIQRSTDRGWVMEKWYVVANRDDTQWMSAIGWTGDVDEALHFARRKDADAFAATDEDAIYIRSSWDFECLLPPEGWFCTRTKGHEGPCAAEQYISPYRESHGAVTSRRRKP